MTMRLKLLIGVALAAFAACHVVAAYELESASPGHASEIMSLVRD